MCFAGGREPFWVYEKGSGLVRFSLGSTAPAWNVRESREPEARPAVRREGLKDAGGSEER